MKPPDDPRFLHGIELLDRGEYYEAHEVLEELWRDTPGAERFFLQALIHFAVGYYHAGQGNREGARRQLAKAARKLAAYLPRFGPVDSAALYAAGLRALAALENAEPLPPLPPIRPMLF